MRWLVDAMNVIGSRPDGWWKDRDAAVGTLIEEVDRWAARGDDEVVVVLERRPPSPIPTAVVEVAHADRSGPDAADDEIVRILRETSGGGPTTVVTSDRRLAARAKAAGAEVEPAGGFRRRLDGEGGEAPSA